MDELRYLVFKFLHLLGLNCSEKHQQKEQIYQPSPVENNEEKPVVKTREPASLCLVIPASAAYNLKKNSYIDIDGLKELINNASYFLCIENFKAKLIDDSLEATDEDITSVNERKRIYVRINVSNAQAMIGKDSQYSLKENLPLDAQGTVEKIYCLKYLSGLEKFNRV